VSAPAGERFAARFRAPAGDGEVLAVPPLADLPDLAARNRAQLDRIDLPIFGEPFQRVRAAARQMLGRPTGPVVATGHQPESFHPGVWIKNFLADRLARRVGGVSVNVVVDSDAAKHLEIAVPRMLPDGSATAAHVSLMPPGTSSEAAYEECPAPDRAQLDEIGRQVESACPNDAIRSAFRSFWQDVMAVHRPGLTIPQLLTAARHRVQERLGVRNVEVLMTDLCATRPFRLLLLHILSDARRFAEVYNAALAEFRRVRRIRSRAHPWPDLALDGDLVELPYWVWRAGERRGRLFARIRGDEIELRHGKEQPIGVIPHSECRIPNSWKVRPRALTTTIFCRLFLGDVFIHGIGGATYDLVTDAVIEQFFGFAPPPYVVCSATVRLPLPTHGARTADLERQTRLQRDLAYNPDRHLDDGIPPALSGLVQEKRALIAEPRGATPAERRARFDAIRAVNAALRPAVAGQLERARERLAVLRRDLSADAILRSREYPFFLFPPDRLADFYAQALPF
jgi:hypothetical protein